ncbi:MAG: hypothetical protein ACKVIG_15920 [Flavobacteriales bacterium]
MKSIVIFMFFISSLTFSQSADVKSINDDQVNVIIKNAEDGIIEQKNKIQKKIDRNWYTGSKHIITGIDENFPVGFRFNYNGFYFDIRSNFGLWGRKDKPNGEEGFYLPANDGYSTNLNYTEIDNSSSSTILNIGYSLKTVKTPNFVLSVFVGGGLALVKSVEYFSYSTDYTPMGAVFTSSFDYFESVKDSKSIINVNFGFELAFQKISLVIGVDTYTLEYNDDSIAGFIGIGKSF